MKSKFKISDIAKTLNLKKDVIRFWGKEFNVQPSNSTDKTYNRDGLKVFESIKTLVHNKGLTINDAKNKLKDIIPAKKMAEPKVVQETPKETVPQNVKTKTAIQIVEQKQQNKIDLKTESTKKPDKLKLQNLSKMTITPVKKTIPAPELQPAEKILVKEVEKIVEVEKLVPYIPQEFLDQVHLVKEQLTKFQKLLN
jgi:DNA-binding transcriptional MerR regulator